MDLSKNQRTVLFIGICIGVLAGFSIVFVKITGQGLQEDSFRYLISAVFTSIIAAFGMYKYIRKTILKIKDDTNIFLRLMGITVVCYAASILIFYLFAIVLQYVFVASESAAHPNAIYPVLILISVIVFGILPGLLIGVVYGLVGARLLKNEEILAEQSKLTPKTKYKSILFTIGASAITVILIVQLSLLDISLFREEYFPPLLIFLVGLLTGLFKPMHSWIQGLWFILLPLTMFFISMISTYFAAGASHLWNTFGLETALLIICGLISCRLGSYLNGSFFDKSG